MLSRKQSSHFSSSMYAIVASYYDDGIQLVDVSDPSLPVAVGAATDGTGGFTELHRAIAVSTFVIGSNTYAIVASHHDDGIQLVDVSDLSLFGGPFWPRDYGYSADQRLHLSVWGSETAAGGCCHTAYSSSSDAWGQAFTLSVRSV